MAIVALVVRLFTTSNSSFWMLLCNYENVVFQLLFQFRLGQTSQIKHGSGIMGSNKRLYGWTILWTLLWGWVIAMKVDGRISHADWKEVRTCIDLSHELNKLAIYFEPYTLSCTWLEREQKSFIQIRHLYKTRHCFKVLWYASTIWIHYIIQVNHF